MATRNIVPRVDGEGGIGRANKKWGKVYADKVYAGTIETGNLSGIEVTAANYFEVDEDGYLTPTLADEVNTETDLGHVSTTILRRAKSYAIGDIAYSNSLPSWARLECVTAGTTSDTDPDFTNISSGGQYLADGSVLWIIDDIRDATPVGHVRGSLYLPAGYILANGAEVLRADYPRLVRLADLHNLWTEDSATYGGLFGEGDGETTFTLPNWIGRMVQLSDGAGANLAAGLPNITGYFGDGQNSGVAMWNGNSKCEGAFSGSDLATHCIAGAQGSSFNMNCVDIEFDASLSNSIYGNSTTVQPPAITQYPIIRY